MTSDQLFIGIDSGTQGTKAVVFSIAQKKIIAFDYHGHDLYENEYGGREQDPKQWIDACRKVLKTILSSPDVDTENIKAIGVSGQQHGLVPLDKHGHVIRKAKLWCDTQTQPQCQALTTKLGGPDAVIKRIGNCMAPGFTASKILWLKDNEPENYDKLATVLLPHEYINFWLTGKIAAEAGDASGTAYFDIKNRTWEQTIIHAIDDTGKLESCLPNLISSQTPIGPVTEILAKEFGLSGDVLVASGGGDNMMAAIGTGNVEPGVVTASLGTSGTIYAYSDDPIIDPNGEVAAFCSSTGGWLPLVCTMNVTVATELIKSLFKYDTRTLNTMAQKADIGSGNIILLPYFNGERTPNLPSATASFHGLTPTNLTDSNLCRSAMEGAALGLKYAYEALKKCGIGPKEIRITGGGSKSPLWRQILADMLDCPVVPLMDPEAGALGAAIQALWCWENQTNGSTSIKDLTDQYIQIKKSELCQPDPEDQRTYADIYERYLAINTAMSPLFESP